LSSSINPTWTDLGSKSSLRGSRRRKTARAMIRSEHQPKAHGVPICSGPPTKY
jgi:hypothetical protein